MRSLRSMALIAALTLLPTTAWANVGTPLMWASMLHLALGNAILGVIEGLLVARIFKAPKLKAVLLLVAANYASAWLGGLPLANFLAARPELTLETLRPWLLGGVVAAFVVTLVIEFPFFWLALRPRERAFRQALVATPAIHAVSYAVLFGWYWLASGTSLLTQLRVVPANEMRVPGGYAAYFLAPEGDRVWRMDLDAGRSVQPVAEVAARHRNDRLFVRPREEGSGFNLFVYGEPAAAGAGTETLVREDFATEAPVEWRIAEKRGAPATGSWFNFGPVPNLGGASDWTLQTGFWPVEGIFGENAKTGGKVHYALEVPVAAWSVRNATLLPAGYVVLQLGEDQICLLHLETRRIALLARGKGPIAAKPMTPDARDLSTGPASLVDPPAPAEPSARAGQ